MPFVDYTKYNFCAGCELTFSKEKGIKCPQCNRKARTLPRNPKVFRENKPVCTYSEIWVSTSNFEARY